MISPTGLVRCMGKPVIVCQQRLSGKYAAKGEIPANRCLGETDGVDMSTWAVDLSIVAQYANFFRLCRAQHRYRQLSSRSVSFLACLICVGMSRNGLRIGTRCIRLMRRQILWMRPLGHIGNDGVGGGILTPTITPGSPIVPTTNYPWISYCDLGFRVVRIGENSVAD